MSAESLKSFFDWGSVILVALTFVFGAGALITGNILNKRQESQLRNLQEALAKQQERAANAELALFEVEQKLADRTLTDAQLGEIAKSLKAFSGQEFDMTPFWDNKESVSIGNRIVSALQKSGWVFIKPEYQRAILGGLVGIKVTIDRTANARSKKAARSLVSSLSKQGLVIVEEEESLVGPKRNKVQIEVGTKR